MTKFKDLPEEEQKQYIKRAEWLIDEVNTCTNDPLKLAKRLYKRKPIRE